MTKHLGLYACGTILLGISVGSVWKASFLRYFIPLALLLVLYPFMFDLEMARIKSTLTRPLQLSLALFVNLVIAPLLAYAVSLVFFSSSPSWLTVGLVMFGCVPCGGMVPAYTGMLKGNVNLAVNITSMSLLFSIVSVPFWAKFLLGALVPVPALLIAQYLFVIILAPFFLAQFTRLLITKIKGPFALEKFKEDVKSLSGPGLMLFIFIIFVLNGEAVRKDPTLILLVMVPVSLLLVTLLITGGVLARAAHSTTGDATALQTGVAVKNTAIAIALAISSFTPEVALVLAISGPLAQLPTMLLFMRWKKNFATT